MYFKDGGAVTFVSLQRVSGACRRLLQFSVLGTAKADDDQQQAHDHPGEAACGQGRQVSGHARV